MGKIECVNFFLTVVKKVNKNMAKLMVERMGHATYTAENGRIPVDIIKEKRWIWF